MIDDLRNSKNLMIYLDQLTEVKARLEYISGYSNSEKDRFIVEFHALQVRKLIELLAFSLMSIHQTKYKNFRANAGMDFKEDWNGREIINNVLKINPDMFFRPAHPGFNVEKDGAMQVNLRDKKDCYSLKRLAKLYDRCGGVLHVANPWLTSTKIEAFHNELPSIIKNLQLTLGDHIVLVNHWSNEQSTAVIFTLNGQEQKPTYYLAEAPGNFTFGNA